MKKIILYGFYSTLLILFVCCLALWASVKIRETEQLADILPENRMRVSTPLGTVHVTPTGEKTATPVLLIHGKDDLVVPVSQSKKMFRALKKSDKEVQLVTFKGGDHGLFKSSTRLKMLKAVDEFLNKHNPI